MTKMKDCFEISLSLMSDIKRFKMNRRLEWFFWLNCNTHTFSASVASLNVDNFTIDYAAVELDSNVRWAITYYRNETNEVFDVETC